MRPESTAARPGIYLADHRSSSPLATLITYRDLLLQLVIREMKLRYKRSVLGVAWAILNPLLAMVVFTIVFSRVFGQQRPNYPLYVIAALLGWNLFSLGTSKGLDSVVANGSIIRKVFVPKVIFPIAAVASQVVNFLFALPPLLLFMAALGAPLTPSLLILPIPLLILAGFALGVALLVGTLNVFFRDVKYFYEALIMVWFYATPVFYPPEIIPEQFRFLLQMNPIRILLETLRIPLYQGTLPPTGLLIQGLAISLVTLAVGWLIFHRFEARFIHYV